MSDIIRKITSRKFIISVAAFIGSIGTGIAGINSSNQALATVGIICAVISAAIYAGCEAYVDAASVENDCMTIVDGTENIEESEGK